MLLGDLEIGVELTVASANPAAASLVAGESTPSAETPTSGSSTTKRIRRALLSRGCGSLLPPLPSRRELAPLPQPPMRRGVAARAGEAGVDAEDEEAEREGEEERFHQRIGTRAYG